MTTAGESERREIMRMPVQQLPFVIEITNNEINNKFRQQKQNESDEILLDIHVDLIDPSNQSLYMASMNGKSINSHNYTTTNTIYLQRRWYKQQQKTVDFFLFHRFHMYTSFFIDHH